MSRDRGSNISRFLVQVSVLIYAAAFFVPNLPYDGAPYWGLMMFFSGMVFFWAVPVTYSWWANILFWIALLCHRRTGKARGWSFVAGILALSFLFVMATGHARLRETFGGLSYWLWTGSMFLYSFAMHLRVPAFEEGISSGDDE